MKTKIFFFPFKIHSQTTLNQLTLQGTLEAYQPAPRQTEADHTGNKHTTNRALDDRLYLVLKHKSTGEWAFPHTPLDPELDLREV